MADEYDKLIHDGIVFLTFRFDTPEFSTKWLTDPQFRDSVCQAVKNNVVVQEVETLLNDASRTLAETVVGPGQGEDGTGIDSSPRNETVDALVRFGKVTLLKNMEETIATNPGAAFSDLSLFGEPEPSVVDQGEESPEAASKSTKKPEQKRRLYGYQRATIRTLIQDLEEKNKGFVDQLDAVIAAKRLVSQAQGDLNEWWNKIGTYVWIEKGIVIVVAGVLVAGAAYLAENQLRHWYAAGGAGKSDVGALILAGIAEQSFSFKVGDFTKVGTGWTFKPDKKQMSLDLLVSAKDDELKALQTDLRISSYVDGATGGIRHSGMIAGPLNRSFAIMGGYDAHLARHDLHWNARGPEGTQPSPTITGEFGLNFGMTYNKDGFHLELLARREFVSATAMNDPRASSRVDLKLKQRGNVGRDTYDFGYGAVAIKHADEHFYRLGAEMSIEYVIGGKK